jgi:hypothetical protein
MDFNISSFLGAVIEILDRSVFDGLYGTNGRKTAPFRQAAREIFTILSGAGAWPEPEAGGDAHWAMDFRSRPATLPHLA